MMENCGWVDYYGECCRLWHSSFLSHHSNFRPIINLNKLITEERKHRARRLEKDPRSILDTRKSIFWSFEENRTKVGEMHKVLCFYWHKLLYMYQIRLYKEISRDNSVRWLRLFSDAQVEKKKRNSQNINKLMSCSFSILCPRDFHKPIFQPRLHLNSTLGHFFQSWPWHRGTGNR